MYINCILFSRIPTRWTPAKTPTPARSTSWSVPSSRRSSSSRPGPSPSSQTSQRSCDFPSPCKKKNAIEHHFNACFRRPLQSSFSPRGAKTKIRIAYPIYQRVKLLAPSKIKKARLHFSGCVLFYLVKAEDCVSCLLNRNRRVEVTDSLLICFICPSFPSHFSWQSHSLFYYVTKTRPCAVFCYQTLFLTATRKARPTVEADAAMDAAP